MTRVTFKLDDDEAEAIVSAVSEQIGASSGDQGACDWWTHLRDKLRRQLDRSRGLSQGRRGPPPTRQGVTCPVCGKTGSAYFDAPHGVWRMWSHGQGEQCCGNARPPVEAGLPP